MYPPQVLYIYYSPNNYAQEPAIESRPKRLSILLKLPKSYIHKPPLRPLHSFFCSNSHPRHNNPQQRRCDKTPHTYYAPAGGSRACGSGATAPALNFDSHVVVHATVGVCAAGVVAGGVHTEVGAGGFGGLHVDEGV